MPGDKVRINLDSLIESFPMVAPNLNGYKASFDFYFCAWSNYYGWMDNNKRSNNVSSTVLAERFTYQAGGAIAYDGVSNGSIEVRTAGDLAFALGANAVKPGSFLDMLGIPPGFIGVQRAEAVGQTYFDPRNFPAEKLISVLDIYRTYYVNPQEDLASFVGITEDGNYDLYRVPLELLDKITLALRANEDTTLSVDEVLDAVWVGNKPEYPVGVIRNAGILIRRLIGASVTVPLGGLPLRTYRMDLNRGIMKNTEAQFVSKAQVVDGSVAVTTLRFANKMQMLLDRIDVSGGRFSDAMRMRWGVTPRNSMNIPDYLGSVSNFFGITDVISTASGTNENVPNGRGNSVLGQQAGFAVGKVKRDNSPISFRADQYGTLVCMFSLVPLVTYSQGIEREDLKTSFAEVFDPAFNQLGYQDVDRMELNALPSMTFPDALATITEDADILSTSYDLDQSVGRRFAWSEYMSSLPRAHGLFAYGQSLDYWVNNRMYVRDMTKTIDSSEPDWLSRILPYGDTSLSTYVDPALQNNLFAEVGRFAQNFRLRVNFDMYMRRNVGSRVMPHL